MSTNALLKNLCQNQSKFTISESFFLPALVIKRPLPPNPPSQPVSNVASKRRHAASLAQVAGRVDAAAIVPARGAVEVAHVVREAGHDAALGVGLLQHLRQPVAGVGAVGAVEDHLVDGRGRAGRYGGGGGDVGCGGAGVGAEGGEHGGGLVAGLGAVGAAMRLVSHVPCPLRELESRKRTFASGQRPGSRGALLWHARSRRRIA